MWSQISKKLLNACSGYAGYGYIHCPSFTYPKQLNVLSVRFKRSKTSGFKYVNPFVALRSKNAINRELNVKLTSAKITSYGYHEAIASGYDLTTVCRRELEAHGCELFNFGQRVKKFL